MAIAEDRPIGFGRLKRKEDPRFIRGQGTYLDDIRTVEGLARNGELDPVQQGFHELHALQCGFCTPGMLMTTRALLNENPDPTEQEIRTAISGGICRCTGYQNIVAAVRWAAQHPAGAPQEV